MADIVNGIHVASCSDEALLEQVLEDLTLDQMDERKVVRSRLQTVKQAARAARDARMEKLSNSREESIQKRKREAVEHKQRTLDMYDQMAKSAPAGGQKVMNINVLRGCDNMTSLDSSVMSDTMSACSSISESGLVSTTPKRDLVEEAIRSRIKAADDEKQRILAAYDAAQKAGPAGTYRVADLRGFKKEDAANFTPPKSTGASTFESSGGIPIVAKGSPARSVSPTSPSGSTPIVLELGAENERLIRERQQELAENKQRILAAYDAASRSGAGPKQVIIPEVGPTSVTRQGSMSPTATSATVCFSGGIARQVSVTPDPRIDQARVFGLVKPKSSTSSATRQTSVQASSQSAKHVATSSSSSSPAAGSSPMYFGTFSSQGTKNAGIARTSTDVKEIILQWARSRVQPYGLEVTNFSSSWASGLVFCAIIHSYFPDSFDFKWLKPQNREHNFELAFKTAEQRAGIFPLLDVEDMVAMKDRPDWKCVFTYVQQMYRSLRKLH